MSERYTKLFALPDGQELYGEGSPVLIAAGVLSKDNQTKNTLVQLKFRSIERRIIRELTVRVQPIDADGAPLGEVEHRYQELSAELEEEFGAKSPIFLNSAGVRSFSVRVTGAVFTDGTVWQDENADWGLLPEKSEIQNVGWEPELRKQFRMEYRTESGYLPWHARGLWLCPCCGKLNRETAEECYSCQTQKPGPDYLETLCQHMNARLEEERKAAAEAAAAAEERRKETAKKAKKIGKIAAVVAVLVVAAVVVYQTVIKNMLAYQDAEQLAQQGEYEEAIAAFEALGDYKDSAEQILAVRYARASEWAEDGYYDGALEEFTDLKDYKDSAEQVLAVKYAIADEELEDGNDERALEIFQELGDYKDCAARIASIQDKQTEKAYQWALYLWDDLHSWEAYAAFTELGDYRDSKEWAEKIEMQYQINGFAGNMTFKNMCVYDYYTDHKEDYPEVSASELTELMPDDWLICFRRRTSVMHLTVNADGTGERTDYDSGTYNTWRVKGGTFYLNADKLNKYFVDESTKGLEKYTVRKLTEGAYIFYDDSGTANYLFVSTSSEWAERLDR